ncbi:PIN domain-containing protein [Streptomyces sp. NPDC093221]|uniref:PIN domain-containing protein n=1 Tax=Streptomyces sp. NPDC093221 TaxID=3366032 RepID=UPI003823DA70
MRLLRGQISPRDIDSLILTPAYATLLTGVASPGQAERIGNKLVDLEVADRIDALNKAVRDLEERLSRWRDDITYVLPDSSFYLEHPDRVDAIDFHDLLSASESRPVIVLFPMAVIDELDRLKETKDTHVRWRAGYTLAVLDRIISNQGRGILHGPETRQNGTDIAFRAETSVEVLFDPPGHVRLPIADDDIVLRALGANSLAGWRGVTLLTYDTGQATRGRFAGLTVKKLPHPAGAGDEPERDTRGGGQPRGTGIRAQRKNRREAELAEADACGKDEAQQP